jgi:hypothetical protein
MAPFFDQRRIARLAGACALAQLFAACEHAKPVSRTDSAAPDTSVAPESSAAPVAARWIGALGPALFVPSDSAGQAFVILPDSLASIDDLRDTIDVRLLGRNGAAQPARLAQVKPSDTTECPSWRVISTAAMTPWSVAFAGDAVTSLALDSIGGMSHADSSRLAASIIRLASALRDDAPGGADSRFVGLPFTVRTAWTFQFADGRHGVVATLQRQINQEASPLEEHTLLIAERDARPGAADDSWTTTYSERSRGDEETVETRELLAAVKLGNQPPLLVLSRDFGDRVDYGLLERTASGWRVRWSGSGQSC